MGFLQQILCGRTLCGDGTCRRMPEILGAPGQRQSKCQAFDRYIAQFLNKRLVCPGRVAGEDQDAVPDLDDRAVQRISRVMGPVVELTELSYLRAGLGEITPQRRQAPTLE